MLSDDDLIDIIAETLARRESPADWRSARRESGGSRPAWKAEAAEPPDRAGQWGFHARRVFNAPWTSLPMKRPFLSEYMVRQMVGKQSQKQIRIPKSAILSPLAEEWLVSRGVSVVREGN